jgi:protease-4
VKLGLADDFGTVDSVAREVIKVENILDYSVKENIAERFAKRLGADVSQSLLFRLFNADRAVIR